MVGPADLVLACADRCLCRSRHRAATMVRGWDRAFAVIIASGWTKTLIFIVVAPIMGLVLGFTFMVAMYWIFRHKTPRRWTHCFANYNCFPPPATVSDTAVTMRRRRWELSPARSTPAA